MVRVHVRELGDEYEFHVNVRRYPIEELPNDDEQLAAWLRQRYVEKDQLLTRMRERWTEGMEVWSEERW